MNEIDSDKVSFDHPTEPGTLEGGDFIWINNKNFLHYRSNLTNCYSMPLGVMATSATAV